MVSWRSECFGSVRHRERDHPWPFRAPVEARDILRHEGRVAVRAVAAHSPSPRRITGKGHAASGELEALHLEAPIGKSAAVDRASNAFRHDHIRAAQAASRRGGFSRHLHRPLGWQNPPGSHHHGESTDPCRPGFSFSLPGSGIPARSGGNQPGSWRGNDRSNCRCGHRLLVKSVRLSEPCGLASRRRAPE